MPQVRRMRLGERDFFIVNVTFRGRGRRGDHVWKRLQVGVTIAFCRSRLNGIAVGVYVVSYQLSLVTPGRATGGGPDLLNCHLIN